MELEALIEQITLEVCSKLSEDMQGGGSEEMAAHMEYAQLNPKARLDEILQVCAKAAQKKLAAVCVPQWFVADAKEALCGTGVKVCTIVSLPGGNTSTAAKYAEVKEAVRNGADEVEIPLNMTLVESGDMEGAKNDLEEAMVPAAGKVLVKAVIEIGALSHSQQQAAAQMCRQCDVDYITVSNILGGSGHSGDDIKNFVGWCARDVKVKAIGKIPDQSMMRTILNAGAERIASSNAQLMA